MVDDAVVDWCVLVAGFVVNILSVDVTNRFSTEFEIGWIVENKSVEIASDVEIGSDLLVNKIFAWELSSCLLVVEVVSLDSIELDVEKWSLLVVIIVAVDVWLITSVVVIKSGSEVSELVCEVDTICGVVYESVVVLRLLIDDNILKLESWFCVVTAMSSVVGNAVVSVDMDLPFDVESDDVGPLGDVERDEVVVAVVCSEVIDWVDISVLILVCSPVDSLAFNVEVSIS